MFPILNKTLVSSPFPNRGEERRRIERMMSICFTRVPIGGLGEPNIYHDLGVFYKNVGILLGGCLTVKN